MGDQHQLEADYERLKKKVRKYARRRGMGADAEAVIVATSDFHSLAKYLPEYADQHDWCATYDSIIFKINRKVVNQVPHRPRESVDIYVTMTKPVAGTTQLVGDLTPDGLTPATVGEIERRLRRRRPTALANEPLKWKVRLIDY